MKEIKVLTGEGKFIVIVVGASSCEGKIMALVEGDEVEATPLQCKLEALARDIGKFGLYSALGILAVLIIRWIIEISSKT